MEFLIDLGRIFSALIVLAALGGEVVCDTLVTGAAWIILFLASGDIVWQALRLLF